MYTPIRHMGGSGNIAPVILNLGIDAVECSASDTVDFGPRGKKLRCLLNRRLAGPPQLVRTLQTKRIEPRFVERAGRSVYFTPVSPFLVSLSILRSQGIC